MDIKQIMASVQALNDSAPALKSKKKKVIAIAPAVPTHLTEEDLLVSVAGRIVAAMGLEQRGVTAADLVATVQKFEQRVAVQ